MFKISYQRIATLLILLIASVTFAGSQVGFIEPVQDNLQDSLARPTPTPSSVGNLQNDQDDVVRVNTNLATIPAMVMDRDGRYITNLQKEDFQIFEDGTEQEISYFAPTEAPFTVFFLLDVSSSMRMHMGALARAATTFLHQLHPDDQIIVASFSFEVEVLSELTTAKKVRGRKEFLLYPGTGTMIYDAVHYALRRMEKIRGRKAIVLFSDGVSGGTLANFKNTLRKAEEQDSLIYTAQFNTDSSGFSAKQIKTANTYMEDLAKKTGGRHYFVKEITELERVFRLVTEELRRQYSLGYYSKDSSRTKGRRAIKVRVRQPNLVVRTRDSYIAKP